MNTTTRNYESMYVIDATLTDEQIDSIIAKYTKLIADQGGEVQAAGRWDKRRLAYEVKGRREGQYILMFFTGEPAVAKELDRVYRISDDCMRFLITRVEPQHIDTSRIGQPQAAAEAAPVEAAVAEEAPAPVEAEPAEKAAPEAAVEAAPEEAAEEAVAEAPAAEEAAVAEEAPAAEEPAAAESTEETEGEEPKAESEA